MKVRITYCQPCQFWGQALHDAQDIYRAHGKQIESLELVAGENGVYRIEVDGNEVFSKEKAERFPDDGEAHELVASG
jgi:selT/selW/selH-like putative selenoprotein